ncbi:serine/threonine-protein kinase [Actinocorallia populi]|uniref:serine/threonine-protein kinase n=1 Tax=Actinocorallia populi TaxID=2079200 RepID=UPI001300A5E3|nr:serine/threonine-protein kinase [Actinocorallia populi]
MLGRIGEGGQGIVYLGERDDGGRYAVKLMRGAIDGSFQREVAAARKAAPIVEVGPDFIVTEYIDGPSLREVVEGSGPLTGPSLYRLAVGTATALAAIHQAGVVHRDFKPGNVLLGSEGPRVIDFGIARQLDATVSATSSVLGTPGYMAPEQVSGQRVMPAADVVAWASTLTFAATGQPPFGQDTLPAILHRILNAAPVPGLLDRPLHELLTACLAKDPVRRPDMQQVLTRLLGHTTMPLPDVLAEGRTIALTPDTALADARTYRWTTLRLSPLARPRRINRPVPGRSVPAHDRRRTRNSEDRSGIRSHGHQIRPPPDFRTSPAIL